MRLLIALPDEQLAMQILCRMEGGGWMAETARTGEDVLAKHASFDVLLLHHCLAGMDGLAAGEQLIQLNPVCPPRVLLLCPHALMPSCPPWADCVLEAGVSVEQLCSFLFVLAQKPLPKLAAVHSAFISASVRQFLADLSMDVRFKGYGYAAWLLERMIPCSSASVHPLKPAYEACARHFGTSPAAVERCVRVAVEQVFTQGSMDGIERHFGATVDPERGKPTNRAFLLQSAETLRSRLLYSFTVERSPNSIEMHHSPAAPTSV